jgi:ATP-dependent helicase/nuclease subunit B
VTQWYLDAAGELLAQAAQMDIVLPEMVVLVPNFQSGQLFIRALAQASGHAVLLPPHVLTLPAWAETVALDLAVLPDSRRAVLLYQSLKQHAWFDEAALWPISLELGRLFDELTRQALSLPGTAEEFGEQLAAAYGTRAQTAIAFEARLVHELWYALAARPQEGVSPAALYALQLAALARTAAGPLCVLYEANLDRQERLFLSAYAQRQPVIRLLVPQEDNAAACLRVAWTAGSSLYVRAQELARHMPDSPWQDRLQLTGTYGLESEAQAAQAQIRLWLAEGRQRIAVVVQDRLTARRLRALLERTQILVADETGWTLDTTVASAGIMRWLETVRADFPYPDVLDLLQSQQCCGDWQAGQREQVISDLQGWLRQHGPVHGWSAWVAVMKAHAADDPLHQVLLRLYHAAEPLLSRRERTLSAWIDVLEDSFRQLGGLMHLSQDQAGAQLLLLLSARKQELRHVSGVTFSLHEFSRWLDHALQGAQFVDGSVDSPLVFTHLAASRLRDFDAVLILGADARQWMPSGANSVFFNQSVRATLGLSTQTELLKQFEQDTALLLTQAPAVRVLWQLRQDDEDNPLAPGFERLDLLHRLAWGTSLCDASLLQWGPPDLTYANTGAGAPKPVAHTDLIPGKISVSAYRSLMDCPYQFFIRNVLGLSAQDDIRADMVKSDYGQVVHAILHEFHRTVPQVSSLSVDAVEAALQVISLSHFSRFSDQDFFAHAWQARWYEKIPHYVRWQQDREKAGWYWHAGEIDVARTWAVDDLHQLTLKGRIDRIDSSAQGWSVLDYKTGAISTLKQDAKSAEESVQLAAYAMLATQVLEDEAVIAQAAFVSLDDAITLTVAVDESLPMVVACSAERLVRVFKAMYDGTPLPANGRTTSCDRCEARGVCRRDHWIE